MSFFTLEFILFFTFFLLTISFTKVYSFKLISITLFNILFCFLFHKVTLIYLFIWSFLLYIYPKIKIYKKTLIFILFSIFQIFFWKLLDLGIFGETNIKVPLGISFFTFQGLTYLFGIEKIPKNNEQLHIKEHWNFLEIFSFVGFFPTISSGPILRANYWKKEVNKNLNFTINNLNIGLGFISLGSFYKLYLSHHFYNIVNEVFLAPNEENILSLLLGVYGYTFEIFFDFAGYSLIAIGLCKLFDLDIPSNFNQPYLSTNIKEFWQRWHISLSNWFRDYVYIPLGGNQNGLLRQNINIFIVMLLSSLWHGISSQYLAWGFLHIFGIMFVNNIHKIKNNTLFNILQKKYFCWFITFNYISFSWIFFHTNSFTQGFEYLKALLFNTNPIYEINIFYIFLIIFSFFIILKEKYIINSIVNIKLNNYYYSTVFWSSIFIFILILSPYGTPPFIYFQY